MEMILKVMEDLASVLQDADAATSKYVEKALEQLAMAAQYQEQDPQSEEVKISLNVSGTPDLHIRNRKQYDKMAKYYDPEKQPFTTATWFMTGWLGKDVRPYKVVEVDGKPFQKYPPQWGPDWYWITKGVSDVTAKVWNLQEIDYNLSEEEKIEKIKTYRGGLRQHIATWPTEYKKIYHKSR